METSSLGVNQDGRPQQLHAFSSTIEDSGQMNEQDREKLTARNEIVKQFKGINKNILTRFDKEQDVDFIPQDLQSVIESYNLRFKDKTITQRPDLKTVPNLLAEIILNISGRQFPMTLWENLLNGEIKITSTAEVQAIIEDNIEHTARSRSLEVS